MGRQVQLRTPYEAERMSSRIEEHNPVFRVVLVAGLSGAERPKRALQRHVVIYDRTESQKPPFLRQRLPPLTS